MALSLVSGPSPYNHIRTVPALILQTDLDASDGACRIEIEVSIYDHRTSTLLYSTYLSENIYLETPDKTATFYLNELIQEAVLHEWDIPDPANNPIIRASKYPFRLEITYKEIQDEAIVTSGSVREDLVEEDQFWMLIPGGVNVQNLGGTSYWTYFATASPHFKFLSWRPTTRVCDKQQINSLYFFNYGTTSAADELHLMVEVYDNDDVKVLGPSDAYDLPVIGEREIALVRVGFNSVIQPLLTTAAYSGTVKYFKLWLGKDESGERVSEIITYYLDLKKYRSVTYLSYQNSIGGFDDIRLLGEVIEKSEFTRTASTQLEISPLYTPDGYRKIYAVREQEGKKAAVGYRSKNQARELKELLISPRVYEQNDDQMLPIEFTDKSKDLVNSSSNMQAVTLEYKYTFKNQSYTPPGTLV